MAGEQKGKAYEALTKLVLEDLKARGGLKGRIFWDERPEGMTIVPDLTIGRSSNSPEICLLITHSGAAGNSHMKYWRNMGELVEAKVFLPSPAKVFNLAFDSVIKEDLKKVQDASFDGQLLVGDKPYGDDLQAWIDANLKDFPKVKEEKVEHLLELFKKDKELKRLIGLLKEDLEALLKKKSPKELDAVWGMERQRPRGKAPTRRETFVRRGLSKLLIFEDLDLALRLYSGKKVQLDELPAYTFDLGLASKTVRRAIPSDEEVGNAVALLAPTQLRKVLDQAPLEALQVWVSLLRNVPALSFAREFVVRNWTSICDSAELYKLLKKCSENPDDVAPGVCGLENNWLYYFLSDVIKSSAKLGQAFGYAQMLRLLRKERVALGQFLTSQSLPLLDTSKNSFLDRGLRDWANRRETAQARGFSDRNIAATAFALSSRLSEVNVTSIPSFRDIRDRIIQTALEQKLVTYRDFQPLRTLILDSVEGEISKVAASFSERSGIRGSGGETTVIQSKSTIINWQSAHHSHTNDKKKELCGRAVALRYSWDAKAKRFISRPGVKKLILVLDGTWRQSDLDALVRSGWDEIYYPDEMDKLAKAII